MFNMESQMRRNFKPQFLFGMRVCPEDSLGDISSYFFMLTYVGPTALLIAILTRSLSMLGLYWKSYSMGILQRSFFYIIIDENDQEMPLKSHLLKHTTIKITYLCFLCMHVIAPRAVATK